MLTAEAMHHAWLVKENSEDARFWAHWITVPGRFSLPTEGPPRDGLKWWDAPQGWPTKTSTAVNLQTLFERIPTSFEQLAIVMYRLRLRDALPAGATPTQLAAGEAYLLAGEYEALYVYGQQVRLADPGD
jgi:hypothetical protein